MDKAIILTKDQGDTIGDVLRQFIDQSRELLRTGPDEGWHYIYIGQLTHQRNIIKTMNERRPS